MKDFFTAYRFERLCFQSGNKRWWTLLCYAAVLATLFPLGARPDPNLLKWSGVSLIWIIALLTLLLTTPLLFDEAAEKGQLAQLLSVPVSPYAIFAAKAFVLWKHVGIILSIFLSVLLLAYGYTVSECLIVFVSLITGLLGLSCLLSLITVFTLGLEGRGLIASVVLVPVAIPFVILGAHVPVESFTISAIGSHLAMQLGLDMILMPLAIFLGGQMLKVAVEELS